MKKNTCDDCMLDKTDACSGRTDGHICSDFLRECSKCPEYDTINHNCPLYCKFIRETLQECLVAELEQIKEEMQNPKETGFDFYDGLDYAERVINKRIAELKGENNEKKS